MGGMVLETSIQEIVSRFHEQQKIAKSEVSKVIIKIYFDSLIASLRYTLFWIRIFLNKNFKF